MLTSGPADQTDPLLTAVARVLAVPRLAAMQVFMLPGDPLPRAISHLTGLTQGHVERLFGRLGTEALAQVLHDEPELTYYYIVVGWLALDSPLGTDLMGRLHDMPAENQAQLLSVLAQMFEQVPQLLAQYLPDPAAATAITEEVRNVFAQEKYGLSGAGFAHPPATPEAAGDDIWMDMCPTAFELHMFDLALRLTTAARFGVPHPLGQALTTTEGLGTDWQVLQLARRFKATPPDTKLAVNGPDLLRLYLSLHVLTLLLLADLQPALMDRLEPRAGAKAPWRDPKQQQQLVTWVSNHVEAFSEICDDYFAHKPAYMAAKAEVQRLAALL